MSPALGRRDLLAGAGAGLLLAGLGGCAQQIAAPNLRLAPIRASTDRITQITVCTRPFRGAGPRIEAEKFGVQTIIHNYGHGGSGWSLSWGSGAIVTELARATGERQVAVIGCGALGLTAAVMLQRAGMQVTIYAKELPPNVRSSLASGLWTPDSRICFEDQATPAFKRQWQQMCRTSYQSFQSLLGLAGDPIEFIDSYFVGDDQKDHRKLIEPADGRPAFAQLQRELVPELRPKASEFAPGSHNLGNHYLSRNSMMMFNISGYSRLLLNDFLTDGGKIEIREFHSPQELTQLPQKTLVNCTGYGARALFSDNSLIPVRGQLARLIPDPEIRYGLFHHGVSFVPRRDGLVFQLVGEDDYYGFQDESATPDRAEAELAVTTIAALFAG